MLGRKKKDKTSSDFQSPLKEYKFDQSMEENIKHIQNILNNDTTLRVRRFSNQYNDHIECSILFIDGMIDDIRVTENIIKPIIMSKFLKESKDLLKSLQYKVIASSNISRDSNINPIIEALLSGKTILLVNDFAEVLIISSEGWKTRAIEESQVEKSLRGPREAFTESLLTNLSMIRRKIKSPKLKFQLNTLGTVSNTHFSLCYIEGIANEKILGELEKRLEEIIIDGVLDTGYIQELVSDAPMSPFKTMGSTDRPDVVAGKLLEGRIAIVLDGTPTVLTLPFLFIEYFQTSEDYYTNYYYSSINRILRILAFISTISVPAIYTALITYHKEMIPTQLLLSVSASRQGIPFPTIVEAIGLLLIYEILRETGVRLPSYVGQALSIVGALVIGQAAVEARFVSAPMVIIVSFSGITGLMLPKITGAVIVLRMILLFLSTALGLYGYIVGILGLLLHLFQIRSFGIPYMEDLSSFDFQNYKDTFIRGPWWYMKYRPKYMTNNRKRQITRGK